MNWDKLQEENRFLKQVILERARLQDAVIARLVKTIREISTSESHTKALVLARETLSEYEGKSETGIIDDI